MLTKATPTISWANPAAITFGDVLSATQLNAIPSVPGTFVYSPAAGTVLNAGANQSLSVTFTPTDTSNYTTQTASVTISADKASSTVNVDCTTGAPFTYTGSPLTPCTANAIGVGNLNESLTVNYTGNVNAGRATATANFGGDANHNGRTASSSFVIGKTTPTITWTNPAAITYGTALSATQLNATASVSGTFVYSPAPGTLLTASANQTLSVTFTPTDTSNYATQTASVTITVNKADSTVTVDCTSGAPFTYAGSALTPCTATAIGVGNLNQSLTVNYTGNLNAGTATATANFAGDANHSGSTGSSSFVIGKAIPTITWTNPAAVTNRACFFCRQAATHKPAARCVLPVPASPIKITGSLLARYPPAAAA